MAAYGLVYYPDIDKTGINELRDQYDPYRDLIDVHLTVIFPVPVDRQALEEHIEAVLQRWSPFAIRLAGLVLSFDRWLFLGISEGKDRVTRLFEDFYTGLLAPHRRHDIEFIPHIGLGYFGAQEYNPNDPTAVPLDEARYAEALQEAEAANFDYPCMLDRLTLVEMDDQFTRLEAVREFVL